MRFLRVLAALLALTACVQGQEWPVLQQNPAHTGFSGAESSLNYSDYGVLWTWETGGRLRYTPLAADLNGNGFLEVVYATFDGVVYAVNADGTLMWSYDAGVPVTSSPAVGSTGGGRFVVFLDGDARVTVLDSSGGVASSYPVQVRQASVSAADLDGDGTSEVIVGSSVWSVDGIPLDYSQADLTAAGVAAGYDVVADVNADGVYERMRGELSRMPLAGDLDGDGRLETVRFIEDVLTGATNVVVYDWRQNALHSFNGSGVTSPLTAADLDGDGRLEVIYCSGGVVSAVDTFGSKAFSRRVLEGRCAYVFPADLNLDGRLELVAASEKHIRVVGVLVDSDGDGLIDYTEDMRGTDRYLRDSDGDGLDDMRDEYPLDPRKIEEADEKSIETTLYDIAEVIAGVGLVGVFIVLLFRGLSSLAESKALEKTGVGGLVKKLRKEEVRESEDSYSRSYFKRGRNLEKDWEDVLLSEYDGEDISLAKELLSLVMMGPVPSDDAAEKLRVSKIKLAKYATVLEEKGYVVIDSSRDRSNPVLRPGDRLTS